MFRLGITAPPHPRITKLVEAEIALGSLSLDLDKLDQLLACALHQRAMEIAMCTLPFCEVLQHSRCAHSVQYFIGGPHTVVRYRGHSDCHGEGLKRNSRRADDFEWSEIQTIHAYSLNRDVTE